MTKNELSELYDGVQFENAQDSFLVTEKDEVNNASVKKVTFNLKGGNFIVCTESIWKHGVNLYAARSNDFEFRKNCDGFAICDYQGQKYLIWVELKSGFSDVFGKAIFQISSCYVKAKSYLTCFYSFKPEEYKEVGIVVSLPEQVPNKSNTIGNNSIGDRRKEMVNPAIAKVRSRYRLNGEIELRGTDFGADKMHLSSNIQLSKLPVMHCTTTTPETVVDLAQILQSI